MNLTIEQHELSKQYVDLIFTVEEGLEYVVSSFSDYERTEGDRILNYIFSAFIKIAESNQVLLKIFNNNPSILKAIEGFQSVMQQVLKLEGQLHDPNEKELIIREGIFPLFVEWKNTIQKELQPFILN
ncbi:hypothetical protein FOA22_20750 [Heyndrickxia oleronia]|uniref:hypothetical protein n=1 Tax=Heyndrickxia oleronia TaxID=38875 RepID=UPI003335C4A7